MSREDRIAFSSVAILSVIFFIVAAISYGKYSQEVKSASAHVLTVNPSVVIGDKPTIVGSHEAPYTLVEFGDYECPPCHAAHKKLALLLKQYGAQVRFVFRNYPLTDIHPNAMRAAIIAEVARDHGKFWQAHDALYTEKEICPTSLDLIEATLNLPPPHLQPVKESAYQAKIRMDIDTADALGVTGTPTFILCLPSGKVIRLNALDDIGRFISP